MSDSIFASVLGRRPPKRKLSIGATTHADPSAPPAKRSGVATQGYLGGPLLPVADSTTGSMTYVAGDTYGGTISHSIVGGHGNSNYMFSGATQLNVNRTPPGVPDSLKNATAYAAFHNSADRGDPPQCHENTRLAILKKIMDWIERVDPATKDSFVMWLYGPAGSGKTAIAQSIAERLAERKMLLASYFFGRLDSSRNHSRSLIATIAYQVALHLPVQVRDQITATVQRHPHVLNLSLEAQIEPLIADPLQPLIRTGYFTEKNAARVIIIDGLDECVERGEQVAILRSLSAALQKHHLPILFFVASRPELEIRRTFDSDLFQGFLTRLALDNDYQVNKDIERFLLSEFKEIRRMHPIAEQIPVDWPSPGAIQLLIWRSSGQFIYAATAIKFVKSGFRKQRPQQCLDIILGLRAPQKDLPFSELDALYCRLFSDVEDWEKASLVLAFHVLRPNFSNYSRERIEVLLGLEDGDISVLFCDLGSVIDLNKRGISFHHASISDFLLDKSRSGHFHIDPPEAHARLAQKLLQFFQNCRPVQLEAKDRQAVDLRTLIFHIERAAGSEELERDICNFDFLRLFDSGFPPSAVYCIPQYISALEKSRLPNADVIYRQQNGIFLDHIEKQLKLYYQNPDLNHLLVCFQEKIRQDTPTFPGYPVNDTLGLGKLNSDFDRSAYAESLRDMIKAIILEESYTLAALHHTKAILPLNLEKGWNAYNATIGHWTDLLGKAGRSEELINCTQNLLWQLMNTKAHFGFEDIDIPVQDYLSRMDIPSNQDYASLAPYLLRQMLEFASESDSDYVASYWAVNCWYLLEKAGRSEELIDYIQHFPLHRILNLEIGTSRAIDMAIQAYLVRMNIVPDRDYTRFALHGLRKLSELLHEHQTVGPSDDLEFDLDHLSRNCVYLMEKAGQSLELIDLVQQLKLTSWPKLCSLLWWAERLETDKKILHDAFVAYLRRTAPHEASTPTSQELETHAVQSVNL